MKKIFISSLLSSSLLFGALSDAEILQVFEGGDEELKYTIDSRKNLPNTNFEEIKIKMSDGENSAYIALYSDGAYIFPDVIDIKNKRLASVVTDLGMLTTVVSSHSNDTSLNGFGISICRI